MNFKAVKGRLVIRKDLDSTTKGGIILVTSDTKRGHVVAVHPKDEEDYQINDVVVFEYNRGPTFKIEDKEYVVVDIDEVLVKL